MGGESKYNDAYFDLAFETVNEKLDVIKDTLFSKASAGSVQRLEARVGAIESTHIPCATVSLVLREVEEMKRTHGKFLEEEFEPVRKATEGAVYFGNHPWQFKAVIAGAVLILLITFATLIPSFYLLSKWNKELKAQQIERLKYSTETNAPR